MPQPSLIAPSLEWTLAAREPLLWLNELRLPLQQSRSAAPLGIEDIHDAEARWRRFAGALQRLFPELAPHRGIIESELRPADNLRQQALRGACADPGRWLIKCDHALPVAGSIKARGGIYEVLVHAENLALGNGLLQPQDDRSMLLSADVRRELQRHQVAVGSTGNLGLSIGMTAAALGFRAIVHMSAEAKAWKKARLRSAGVEVVEHRGDYGAAVAAGRAQAQQDPQSYFVDDENSRYLFLGYSVAALRLQRQFDALGVRVDQQHPLFVYLPCGVGGAPGGITFGLRHVLGDHVHCFFAEPVASPCMLLRLAARRPISVRELGLDNRTEADGLAVGQASELVARMMEPACSGVFTVSDDELFAALYLLERTEGLTIEPSAAAGLHGPRWLLQSAAGREYLDRHGLQRHLAGATHILWTTGGALVPPEEYRRWHERGRTGVR